LARPLKSGLDYFPLDIDFFTDEKIQYISGLFGDTGEIIIIKLLCKIYREGYYIKWNEDSEILFAKHAGNGISPNKVHEIVEKLLQKDFFNSVKFKRYSILTSSGIQKRYQRVASFTRRKTPIFEKYKISSGKTPINDVQRKEKKRKEKEIKVKESDSLKIIKNGDNDSKEIRAAAQRLHRQFNR